MADESEFSIRVKSMLRRAGLGEVPMPVVVCMGALCAALLAVALVHFWPAGQDGGAFETTGGGQTVPGQVSQPSVLTSSAESSDSSVAVDVEGAVRNPGVYRLEGEARVVDAVDAAGGFARGASRTSVNLAQKLEDGTQVYVATKREASAGAESSAQGSGSSPAGGGSSSESKKGPSGKVNINTASAEELQTLSGIGPSLSQRIVEYRESKGAFSSIEGLKGVSGIGDARFESIKDSICV